MPHTAWGTGGGGGGAGMNEGGEGEGTEGGGLARNFCQVVQQQSPARLTPPLSCPLHVRCLVNPSVCGASNACDVFIP